MIRKLLHFLSKIIFIVNLFLGVIYSQSDKYQLVIKSVNTFELFVNDVYLFRGNNFDTLLTSGKYRIEAYFINSEPVMSVYKKEIELNSDTIIYLNQNFPFTLRTKPPDAKVFIDSIFFGYTPVNFNLLFKPRILSVSLNDEVRTYNLEKFTKYDFEIDFEKIFSKSTSNINYKYIALASTIVNGIFSSYFKQKADKFYYKPNRSQSDYDIVKRYDFYSAVFTVGMEISFGIFVYLLFNE